MASALPGKQLKSLISNIGKSKKEKEAEGKGKAKKERKKEMTKFERKVFNSGCLACYQDEQHLLSLKQNMQT